MPTESTEQVFASRTQELFTIVASYNVALSEVVTDLIYEVLKRYLKKRNTTFPPSSHEKIYLKRQF